MSDKPTLAATTLGFSPLLLILAVASLGDAAGLADLQLLCVVAPAPVFVILACPILLLARTRGLRGSARVAALLFPLLVMLNMVLVCGPVADFVPWDSFR